MEKNLGCDKTYHALHRDQHFMATYTITAPVCNHATVNMAGDDR